MMDTTTSPAIDVKSFIGKPYCRGHVGPDAFDCWGLVWHVYQLLGIDLPRYSASMSLLDVARKLSDAKGSGVWKHLDWFEVQNFDIVLMKSSRRPHHVGLLVLTPSGPYVLHACPDTGVLFTPVRQLDSLNMSLEGVYAYAGNSDMGN